MIRKSTFLLLLIASVVCLRANAQNGCTDPRASNYNSGAVVNDGSCQYTTTSTAPILKAQLPSEVVESSGLQYTDQRLWTFNDSGHEPMLYRLDPNLGTIQQRVLVNNFSNIDWEDIAADAQYLYIGDFGNNNGNRRDLRILRVRKADIGTSTSQVAAQAIQFSYPDQTNFNFGTNNHNFDCEAFFYANDSLHLFTKNWSDLRTTYYTVPATPGTHVARRRASFNTNGLITAADINTAGTEASLLGYNQSTGATFLWLLFDFRGANFLSGNKRRVELPNALTMGQAEGLTFTNRYSMLLSNEQVVAGIFVISARLHELNASQWLAPSIPTASKQAQPSSVTIFPNPASHSVQVRSEDSFGPNTRYAVQELQGRTVVSGNLAPESLEQEIKLQQLAAGIYLLRIQSDTNTSSRRLVIQ